MAKFLVRFAVLLSAVGVLYFVSMRTLSSTSFHAKMAPLTVAYMNTELGGGPEAPYWRQIDAMEIRLFPQNARAPYGTEERTIRIRAVHNEQEIQFMLEYPDSTADTSAITAADACAIMLVPADSAPTVQMMGHGGQANIWHWRADNPGPGDPGSAGGGQTVNELIATGPGTQTKMAEQNVAGTADYSAGRWRVTFKRTLAGRQTGEIGLGPRQMTQIAFAVWDGANLEKFSKKSISILRPLTLAAAR